MSEIPNSYEGDITKAVSGTKLLGQCLILNLILGI